MSPNYEVRLLPRMQEKEPFSTFFIGTRDHATVFQSEYVGMHGITGTGARTIWPSDDLALDDFGHFYF